MSAAPSSSEPVFIAIDADGVGTRAAPRVIARADGDSVRIFAADALDDIAAALNRVSAYSRDALTEQFWLDRLFAAGRRRAPVLSDWMQALAPFGVARNLAAIMREATLTDDIFRDEALDAVARAAHMRAVYELARAKAT